MNKGILCNLEGKKIRYFIKSLTPGQEKPYVHKPENFYSYFQSYQSTKMNPIS